MQHKSYKNEIQLKILKYIQMARLTEKNYDKLLHFIMIGDSEVGKTAICKRFLTQEAFKSDINATIGVDIHLQVIQVGGKKVKMQIWDTAGEERYEKLTTKYYNRADGVLVVYDVTRLNTFKNIQNWLQTVKLRCKENVPVILIGNKTDLGSVRKVSTSSGRKRSEAGKINFIETSAMTGENIVNCFEKLAHLIMQKTVPRISTPISTPKLKYSKEIIESKS